MLAQRFFVRRTSWVPALSPFWVHGPGWRCVLFALVVLVCPLLDRTAARR
jgi:hypothetical protein